MPFDVRSGAQHIRAERSEIDRAIDEMLVRIFGPDGPELAAAVRAQPREPDAVTRARMLTPGARVRSIGTKRIGSVVGPLDFSMPDNVEVLFGGDAHSRTPALRFLELVEISESADPVRAAEGVVTDPVGALGDLVARAEADDENEMRSGDCLERDYSRCPGGCGCDACTPPRDFDVRDED